MSDEKRPIGGGGARHPNSLGNLPNLRGETPAGAWPPGMGPNLRSGWRTRNPSRLLLDPVVQELAAELGEGAPVRDEHGDVPVYDRAAIESAAIDVLILRRVHGYLELHGWQDPQTGSMRPEVEHLGKANARLAGKLAQLGMTPTSRARLGLDLARTVDLATAMSDPDPERRAHLMAEAGVPIDEEGAS